MREKHRKAVSIIMAVITTVTMNACSRINQKTADDVCNALKAKYEEEFVATYIGDRLNTSTATLYVVPKDNPEIVFSASIDKKGNVEDEYCNQLVMNKIERRILERFEKEGIPAAVDVVITNKDIFENEKELDPNSFMKKNAIESVLVKVIIKGDTYDKKRVLSLIEDESKEYDFDLVLYVYMLDEDEYEACKQEFALYPSVGATIIENYSLICSFNTVVSNGKASGNVTD